MRYAALGAVCSVFLSGTGYGETPSETPAKLPPTLAWPAVLEQSQREALEQAAPALVRVHLAATLAASLGRMAERKGTTAEVRRLGRLVAADLGRADRELEDYTSDKHQLDLHKVTRIVDHTRALRRHVHDVRDQLGALGGAAFDRRFLEMVSQIPEESTPLLGDGWWAVPDPRLRAELDRMATLMQQHREIADSLTARRHANAQGEQPWPMQRQHHGSKRATSPG